MPQHTEEVEAAQLEGAAPMPEDLLPLREEKLELDRQIAILEARKDEIKDIFNERLRQDGLKHYVLDGKNKASRTGQSLAKFMRDKFLAENPVLAARYTVFKKESERTFRIDIRP